MIDQTKLFTGIALVICLGIFGFYFDFQLLKTQVFAVEKKIITIEDELGKLDQIKEVQCEVAIYLFGDKNRKPDKVLKHCKI
jgi:hypothetical protein